MILTPEALASIRNYIKESVGYAKYQVAGVWHQIGLSSVDILPDGRITVTLTLGTEFSEPIEITGIQVYSVNDVLVAETVESIECIAPQEGILYRFRFNVKEVE